MQEGVESIPDYAFNWCSSLVEATLPDGLTGIGNYAFNGCASLKQISIPGTVIGIGAGAFSGCSGLARLTLGDGIRNIGSDAFYECTGLAQVRIPGSVETVGDNSFYGCSNLKVLILEEGVKTIEEYAFFLCSKLTQLVLSGGMESIDEDAFFPNNTTSMFCLGDEDDLYPLDSLTFPKKCQVYCYPDTPAQAWAESKGFAVVLLDEYDPAENRSVALPCGDFELAMGAYRIVAADVFPSYDDPQVTWSVGDSAVASVDDGVVTGLSLGETTLTAALDGKEASVLVTVVAPPCEHVWGEPQYTWNLDGDAFPNLTVTAVRTCTLDASHTEEETVKASARIVSPTQTEPGKAVFTSASFKNNAFRTQSGEQEIPSLESMDVLALPADLMAIRNGAFAGTDCQAVLIPDGCESLGAGAFTGCGRLIYVRLPAALRDEAETAFTGGGWVWLDWYQP